MYMIVYLDFHRPPYINLINCSSVGICIGVGGGRRLLYKGLLRDEGGGR
jgi:hypothetical protein